MSSLQLLTNRISVKLFYLKLCCSEYVPCMHGPGVSKKPGQSLHIQPGVLLVWLFSLSGSYGHSSLCLPVTQARKIAVFIRASAILCHNYSLFPGQSCKTRQLISIRIPSSKPACFFHSPKPSGSYFFIFCPEFLVVICGRLVCSKLVPSNK